MSAATHLLDEHVGEEVLWTRPVWRDPRAMREVERGVVVERLRPRVRELIVAAAEHAGIYERRSRRSRVFGAAQRAVQIAETLRMLQPVDSNDILLANALLAAGAARRSALKFKRLQADAYERSLREYATIGFAVAAARAGEVDEAIHQSLRALKCTTDDVASRGAITLVIHATILGRPRLVARGLSVLHSSGDEALVDLLRSGFQRQIRCMESHRLQLVKSTLRSAGANSDFLASALFSGSVS